MKKTQKSVSELIELAERQLADLEAHVRALRAYIDKLNSQECTCTPDCVTVCAACREMLDDSSDEPFPY